jgi:hypothetical protein
MNYGKILGLPRSTPLNEYIFMREKNIQLKNSYICIEYELLQESKY